MPLPWASPAKTLFQASKPAPVLPQGAASTEPAISPRTAANNAAQPKCLSAMRSSAFPRGPLGPARLLEIVNLNHFRKNVPTLIPNGRRVGNGDGFSLPSPPRRELSGRSPDPPVRGFFFCGTLQPRVLQPRPSIRAGLAKLRIAPVLPLGRLAGYSIVPLLCAMTVTSERVFHDENLCAA